MSRVGKGRKAEQFGLIDCNIEMYRIMADLTQTQVCDLLREDGFDVDQPYVSSLERGFAMPSGLAMIESFCRILQTTASSLYGPLEIEYIGKRISVLSQFPRSE